jgi:hypothetical protein
VLLNTFPTSSHRHYHTPPQEQQQQPLPGQPTPSPSPSTELEMMTAISPGGSQQGGGGMEYDYGDVYVDEDGHEMDPSTLQGVRGMGPAAHDDSELADVFSSERRGKDVTTTTSAAAATATVTTLGDLPSEIVAYVLKLAAPSVAIYAPVVVPVLQPPDAEAGAAAAGGGPVLG